MKRTNRLLGVALFLIVACDAGSSRNGSPQSVQPPSGAVSATPLADPLEGEWHQRFTCEQNVRTFQTNLSELRNQKQRLALAHLKGNNDTSIQTLLLEYTPSFAWGPHAPGPSNGTLTATQIRPAAICKGASERERTLRFLYGTLVVRDWDMSTWGPASYEFVDDHTITVDDGGANFGCCPSRPTDTFSFRIDGDTLAITMIGQDDPWGGTDLEEAPWRRVN